MTAIGSRRTLLLVQQARRGLDAGMAGSPSEDEIMAAIEASGYLMEQEVAMQLERRGMHVRTNVAFEDSKGQVARD